MWSPGIRMNCNVAVNDLINDEGRSFFNSHFPRNFAVQGEMTVFLGWIALGKVGAFSGAIKYFAYTL